MGGSTDNTPLQDRVVSVKFLKQPIAGQGWEENAANFFEEFEVWRGGFKMPGRKQVLPQEVRHLPIDLQSEYFQNPYEKQTAMFGQISEEATSPEPDTKRSVSRAATEPIPSPPATYMKRTRKVKKAFMSMSGTAVGQKVGTQGRVLRDARRQVGRFGGKPTSRTQKFQLE